MPSSLLFDKGHYVNFCDIIHCLDPRLICLFFVFFSGGGANFVLSTSCLGFNPVIGAVAAMVTGGYGAFYSIEEDK